MVDVSGLIPEARPIAEKVATVYLKHTAPWFIGLIVHGSAVKTGELQEGFVGPIPGAYYLVAGKLPVAEAAAQQLRSSARRALTELDPAPTFVMGELLGPGRVRLARNIRLLCTKVWPVLYQVLTCQQNDAIAVSCLPKEEAIAQLPPNSALHGAALGFYQAVKAYYPAENSLDGAFSIIEFGVAFLKAAKSWWDDSNMTPR
jgi:hypothetical protein